MCAIGVIISAFLVLAAAGVAAKTGGEIAGKTVLPLSASDPMGSVLDAMLRPAAAAQAAPANTQPVGASERSPSARNKHWHP